MTDVTKVPADQLDDLMATSGNADPAPAFEAAARAHSARVNGLDLPLTERASRSRRLTPRSKAQAAHARVALDRRLGITTPTWIVALAEKALLR